MPGPLPEKIFALLIIVIVMKISFGNCHFIIKAIFYLFYVAARRVWRHFHGNKINLLSFMSHDLSEWSMKKTRVCKKKAPTESSCNSKKHNRRRKIINENDENDKRKLSEPRLTLDFPHHETSEHEQLLSVWKIWTPHFSSLPIDNNEKRLYIGEEIMWYDKGWWWNIFSNTNNFHCVPLCRWLFIVKISP